MIKISHSLLLIACCSSVVGPSSSLLLLLPAQHHAPNILLMSPHRRRGCGSVDTTTKITSSTLATSRRYRPTKRLLIVRQMSPPPPPPPSLGNNYLDSIDNNNNNNNDDDNDDYDYGDDDEGNDGGGVGTSNSGRFRNNDGRQQQQRIDSDAANNNRWGNYLFGQSSSKSISNRGAGIGGGGGLGGMGGMRTAIRPSPPNNIPGGGGGGGSGILPPGNNYGIGRGGRMQTLNGGESNGIVPRIVSINRPQDLLDFVIQDERLSVVKVYASWCKTCQVFDVRYRKLASQLGDSINSNINDPTSLKGSVRFAEMRFDDPNNEEMCRLLNATKLPYIIMYRGSRGKVADFQCGPAKFQLLIDAVNEHVDTDAVGAVGGASIGGSVGSGFGANGGEGEQEWRVVREQQVRNQQMRRAQQAAQYGGSGSIANYPPSSSSSNSNSFDGDMLKRKEDEVTRLYTELSNLRKGFDQNIVRLKEEHKQETTVLNERIQRLTKEYDEERRALSAQIKDLSREMIDREKAIRSNENTINEGLRKEMKRKEEEYATTLSGLSSRINALEQDLLQSNNALQYNSNSDTMERQQLLNHIATLEQRITELEKELIEEKRVVVASTEEASRVLRQLEKIKNSEDRERNLLSARIVELEMDIARREEQMMNYSADSDGKSDLENMQQQMEELRKARDEEIDLLRTRIADLEEELDWQSRTSSMDETSSSQEMQRQQQELLKESKQLTSRIVELENEIDDRDKLLRTSNKATDILLDNMEAQKRDYERELERTASLVNELEEAIALREEEMRIFQERYDALERMAEDLKRREDQRDMAAESSFANAVQIAEMRSKQQQQGRQAPGPYTFDSLFGGSTGQTRNSGGYGSSDEDSIENYELLKDVLIPDEVAPRREQAMPRSGAGRSDNIWENVGAGLSSLMSSSFSGGSGRYDDTRAGAGSASFGSNTPSPAAVSIPAGIPTPAMAFERRLAENPIVPAGAFGGSKPTSSFFSRSPKSSESIPTPSDTPDYYQNVISNFNNNPPEISPRASYEQRPTAPSPRVSATPGMTENIYAGAGSASAYPSPAAIRQDEPIAPVPTPAMAFERRLAENPIVPSGAFGGAKPTAHFFSPKSAPASSAPGVGGPASPPDDDPQSKWRKLDESEKKRVAAEAYKAFEKSLEDSRRNTQIKPKSDTMSRTNGGITGGGGGGSDRVNKRPASADAKNQSQMELERKKHHDMVKAATTPANIDRSQSAPPLQKSIPKNNTPPKQNLSTRQIQASAVQASAKRMSLAERAAQTDQVRRDREKRLQNDGRNPQMNTRMDPAVPNQVTNSGADDVKRAEEIKRADDLKRKAEADLAAVAEAKAKLAADSAKQSEIKSNNMKASDKAEVAKSERLWRVEPKSSESKEIIEAALLGALEPDDSSGDGQDESKADNKSEQQTTDKRSEKAVTAQRKPRKPQYDVIFLKEKDEIDAPQLLEGSLKDLLNDGSMRKRRSPSGDNY